MPLKTHYPTFDDGNFDPHDFLERKDENPWDFDPSECERCADKEEETCGE